MTHTTTYDLLERSVAILGSFSGSSSTGTCRTPTCLLEAHALRCVSGYFYKHGVAIYQQKNYASATRFLSRSCVLTTVLLKVPQLWQAQDEPSHDKDESWTKFEQQVSVRWELLGLNYHKIGEHHVSVSK